MSNSAEIKVKVPHIAYAHVMFEPVLNQEIENRINNKDLSKILITLKTLLVLPMISFEI